MTPILIGVIYCLVLVTGSMGFIPRLRASSQSPDGAWTVNVYEKRLWPRPFFPRMGAVAKVFDKDQKLVFEKVIYHDDDFDDTVGTSFNTVSFVGDEALIGPDPYIQGKNFVINLAELRK